MAGAPPFDVRLGDEAGEALSFEELRRTVLEVAGKGVRLQRFKDGGLSDAKAFALADGLTWIDKAGRNHSLAKSELRDWIGSRADAGRLAPKGFPESNTFK
jgi:hypothetical protein